MADDFMDLLSGGDAPGGQGQGDKGMEDLLGGLLGGASGSSGADAGDMAGLLGGLMSGGNQGASGDAGLGGLLGGLLGGGGAGGLGGLLGGLMGGGQEQMSFGGGGGASLPFAGTLAEKLGISEQMANMLIMGAIGLLTSSMAKNRSSGGVDLNRVADPDFIRSSGVAGRLSNQMGISEDEAILGLQQTMGLMVAGGQPARPAAKKTRKTATTKKPAAPKVATAKTTTAKPKKKSVKKASSDDFMDLLDDPNR